MVVSRKWKLVGGGLSVAVVMGSGVAVAQSGDEPEVPTLDDVVTLDQVTTTTLFNSPNPTVVFDDSLSSPFSEMADDTPDEADPTLSGGDPSGEDTSPAEVTMDSPQSEASPDDALDEPSPVSPESPDTPPTPDSPDSPESPDSADSPS